MTSVLIGRGKFAYKQGRGHSDKRGRDWGNEVTSLACQGCWQHQHLPSQPPERTSRLALGLQKRERVNVCCFKSPSSWLLVMTAQETHYAFEKRGQGRGQWPPVWAGSFAW